MNWMGELHKLGVEVLEGSADVSGSYKIVKGISPDTGLAYTGSVKIVQTGSVHSMTWNLGGGESYQGAGIREGEWLIVGWGKGSGAGVVRYKVSGRSLSGVWAQPGGKAFGTENLTRK